MLYNFPEWSVLACDEYSHLFKGMFPCFEVDEGLLYLNLKGDDLHPD